MPLRLCKSMSEKIKFINAELRLNLNLYTHVCE